MFSIISSHSFRCRKCQKEFKIKGYWCNQMLIEWWGEVIWILHCLRYHRSNWNKSDFKYAFKTLVSFVTLLVLQILDILAYPFRML